MYRMLTNTPSKFVIKLEKRPQKFMFGINNYGEIPRYYNPADKDPWDIILTGYDQKLPTGIPFRVSKLVGVYMLPNGNHKLIVDIERNAWPQTLDIKNELEIYKKNYESYTKLRGSLIFFDQYCS